MKARFELATRPGRHTAPVHVPPRSCPSAPHTRRPARWKPGAQTKSQVELKYTSEQSVAELAGGNPPSQRNGKHCSTCSLRSS